MWLCKKKKQNNNNAKRNGKKKGRGEARKTVEGDKQEKNSAKRRINGKLPAHYALHTFTHIQPTYRQLSVSKNE